LPDQNGEFVPGHFPIAISNAYDRRVSAAIGYLDPATRQRANLTISTDTQVQELLFEGLACVGAGPCGGPGAGVPRAGGDIVVRGDPFAGPSAGGRGLGRRGICGRWAWMFG